MLFRDEVIKARQTQWLGGIRVGRTPRFQSIAMAALVAGALLILFSIFGQVSQKTRVPGVIVPPAGTIQISSPSLGVINKLLVKEGSRVKKGDIIFVLDTDRNTKDGSFTSLAQANVQLRKDSLEKERDLRKQQSRERELSIRSRIALLSREILNAEQESKLASRRAELAEKTLLRFKELARSGYVSDIQFQVKDEELIDQQLRAEGAKRNAELLRREKSALESEIVANASQLEAELYQIERNEVQLSQEESEYESRKQIAIIAPQSGVVTNTYLPAGASILEGQAVATLVPETDGDKNSRMKVHVFAPSKAIGFAQQGQTVWIRIAAYPYQKFGLTKGTIDHIATTPSAPQDLPNGQANALLAAAQSNEPLYRIQVTLANQKIKAYGRSFELKPGMFLEADLVHDTRSIWEWIFDPILATREVVRF